MPMTLAAFRDYVRQFPLGVVSTSDPVRGPEAALLSFAVTPDGDLLFDTLADARKVANIRHDPRVALVIGCVGPSSLQVEGVAALPDADQRRAWAEAYEAELPGSSAFRPEFTVVRVTVTWLRHYDASVSPALVSEGSPAWHADPAGA